MVAGSAHEAYLKAFFPKAAPATFDTIEGARAALRRGEADLAFGDGLTLAVWLAGAEGAACCAFAGGPYTESRFFGEGVGIALRKEDAALRRALDHALHRLAETGRYAEIYLRYFPVSFY